MHSENVEPIYDPTELQYLSPGRERERCNGTDIGRYDRNTGWVGRSTWKPVRGRAYLRLNF